MWLPLCLFKKGTITGDLKILDFGRKRFHEQNVSLILGRYLCTKFNKTSRVLRCITYHVACNCNTPSHRSHATARCSSLQPAVSTQKTPHNMYLNSVSGFVYDTLYDTLYDTVPSSIRVDRECEARNSFAPP